MFTFYMDEHSLGRSDASTSVLDAPIERRYKSAVLEQIRIRNKELLASLK
jgi:hypothetical protein